MQLNQVGFLGSLGFLTAIWKVRKVFEGLVIVVVSTPPVAVLKRWADSSSRGSGIGVLRPGQEPPRRTRQPGGGLSRPAALGWRGEDQRAHRDAADGQGPPAAVPV